jgi:hypothetical protein
MATTNPVKTNLRRAHRALRGVAAFMAALSVSTAGAALIEGKTNAGHRYLAGGIGAEEVDAMRAQAPGYSLHLITAAKSGAYVAGVHIRIVGPGNDVVLDTTIDAPWLLIALPAGRYTVRATHSGDAVERRLDIAPGKAERVVLHFDVPVDGDGAPQAASPVRPRLQ